MLFGCSLMKYLSGGWSIARRIEDERGANALFEGTGMFTATGGDALAYLETGTLTLNGTAHVAERRYLWTFPAPSRAMVAFGDGRPFHAVTLEGHGATARHLCPPDTYEGAYAFDGADAWRQDWVVRGPRKRYRSETRYRRLHP